MIGRELLFLGILVLSVFSVRASLADHYFVPSGSMLPTVQLGDHLVVNKLAYGLRVPFTTTYLLHFDTPAPGEVVVLESPKNGVVLLKRVVAGPGDRVEVRHGLISLNGAPVPVEALPTGLVEELGEARHHIRAGQYAGGPDYGPTTLGPNEFLVMGDNRGDSEDGRAFGLVPRELILGRAISIYMRESWDFTWTPLDLPAP